MSVYVGVDIGTSACRACAIDAGAVALAEARIDLPQPEHTGNGGIQQDPGIWWQAVQDALDALTGALAGRRITRIALDGTSATLLLCRPDGTPLTPGLMYNDTRAARAAGLIADRAAPESAARGNSSSLAKCLHLRAGLAGRTWLALHQADWLTGQLSGEFGTSDENNALKLGYDVERRCWPEWLAGLQLQPQQLPRVYPPGAVVGRLRPALARRWSGGGTVEVVAGTTDSSAGFIAAGADRTGMAVTALGSTLVLKVLSDTPVFAARYGVYSHRLGGRWLVGGASNSGGAVLRQYFSRCDIRRFTRLLQPDNPTGLDYYPLPATGERFPVQDPDLAPRLQPRPASDARFFQGILEGLAAIEARGYRLLAELGARYPSQVLTVGGGAANTGWRHIREACMQVPVSRARHQEAAYGAALLALRGESVFAHP
jgi:sugar (pentulose or hexulose) kinase